VNLFVYQIDDAGIEGGERGQTLCSQGIEEKRRRENDLERDSEKKSYPRHLEGVWKCSSQEGSSLDLSVANSGKRRS